MRRTMIGLLAAAIAAQVLAQQATGKSFDDLDIDGDGRVSLAEAEKDVDVARAFISADANKDGYLSRAEFGNLGQGLTPETAP